MRRGGEHGTADPGALALRRLLLALVLFGTVGLLLELLLLEHFETPAQWAPLAVLLAGLAAGGGVALRPGRRTLLAFRAAMWGFVATGLVGLVLHYRGNAAFEREMDASLGGLALVWSALRGATPALAPGALAQLGILGLILAHRHPATGRPVHGRPAPDHRPDRDPGP